MALHDLIYRVVSPIDKWLTEKNRGKMLNVGDTAPEFTVKSHQGKDISLKDFRGKNVVLYFYPKADTPGCTAQSCGFRDRMADYEKKNTVVLGVSFDSVVENKAFADKFGFPFLLLCDTEKKIGLAYGAANSKEDGHPARIGYVIDPQGKVKGAYPKVDARTFPSTVINEI